MRTKPLLPLVASIIAGAGLLALMWMYGFTVVPMAQVQQAEQSEAFDPVKYVDGIWASKIIPTITQKAVDLPTILNEMKPDADGYEKRDDLAVVAKQYGLITVGEAHVYNVKGSGKVLSIDTSSKGSMEIQLEGYSGPIQIFVYCGSSIPSDNSSIRDAVGFINFGDFKEQTQYGKVSAEINSRVIKEVLAPLDKSNLQGKTVSFIGSLTIRTFNLVNIDLSKIMIVPIKIEVKE